MKIADPKTLPAQATRLNRVSESPTTSDKRPFVLHETASIVLFGILGVVLVTALTLHRTPCLDLWWQIRAGNDAILHGPQHSDTFSWTRYGKMWNANEWLSFVLFAVAYDRTGNLVGPFLVMEGLTITLGLLLYSILVQATNRPPHAFAVTALSITAMQGFLQPRPFLFSYLFVVLIIGIVRAVLSLSVRAIWLGLLPPLFALWSNLHQAVVIGIGLCGLIGLVSLGETLWKRDAGRTANQLLFAKRAACICAAAAAGFAASMATPYGLGLYQLLWVTMRDSRTTAAVSEWKPFHPEFTIDCVCLGAFYALLTTTIFHLIKRQKLKLSYAAATFLCAVEGLMHARNLPFMTIVPAVLFGPSMSDVIEEGNLWCSTKLAFAQQYQRQSSNFALPFSLATAFTLFVLVSNYQTVSNAPPLASSPLEQAADASNSLDWFPMEAVSFMNYNNFPANMRFFNDYDFGGLLIFYRPTDRVFIDGRDDVYAGPFLNAYYAIPNESEAMRLPSMANRRFLDTYTYDCAITRNPTIAYYFATRPGYELVYVHHLAPMFGQKLPNCWIFVRDLPEYSRLIEQSRQVWAEHNQGLMPEAGL